MDFDDLKMSNCAQCRCVLLAKSMGGLVKHLDLKSRKKLPPTCYGYIKLRPYCEHCYEQIVAALAIKRAS